MRYSGGRRKKGRIRTYSAIHVQYVQCSPEYPLVALLDVLQTRREREQYQMDILILCVFVCMYVCMHVSIFGSRTVAVDDRLLDQRKLRLIKSRFRFHAQNRGSLSSTFVPKSTMLY